MSSYNAKDRHFKFNLDSSDYDTMMDMVNELGAKTRVYKGNTLKGWNQNPNTILNAMTKIAFHETGGTLNPSQVQNNPKKNQEGMGLFQYERGEGQGANTAINRTKNYFKGTGRDVPSWLENFDGKNLYDVSQLTPSQQYILFLGDKAMDETAHMRDIHKEGGVKNFWAKEHWAGPADKLKERLSRFDANMGVYKDTLLDQVMSKQNK